MKLFASVAASLVAVSIYAQDLENQHFISVYAGKSAILLGSSEVRFDAGVTYGYARHEPRFENRFLTSQLVLEGYYEHSLSGTSHSPYDESDALGFLYYGRWFARWPKDRPRPFLDFGWGFQDADRRTIDLPSEINSTPFADIGYAFPIGENRQALISLRYLHISNAGFVAPNRGQNQISLVASISF